MLRTDRQGYRLTLDPSSVDSRQLAAAAEAVLTLGDDAEPDAFLDATSTALGLWRGRPYDGIEDSGWTQLAEHRLTVQRARDWCPARPRSTGAGGQ